MHAVPGLFDPLTIRGLTIPNRVAMSPMCMYRSEDDGQPTDWHLIHLGSRAAGGVGLVITEATAVAEEGRITPGDLGLWSDTQISGHRRIVNAVREFGAVAGVQLSHSGRKGGRSRPWDGNTPLPSSQWGKTLAPSPIPFKPEWQQPTEMTHADIAQVIDSFAAATRRARDAGYQVVEGHFAHGYLMHQFLSPFSNRRTDEYGGGLENRARLPLAVAHAIRDEWPSELPVFMRLSLVDWIPGGVNLEESIQVAAWMREMGIDLIDGTSSGIIPGETIPEAPLYHLDMSRRLRAEAGIATSAVGRVRTAQEASRALSSEGADLVLVGRAMLQDAYWARHAARDLEEGNRVEVPVQYRRATQHLS
ncbi:NADH:flavin oxidoreductase/NADH oxidase [Microbacterium caowuchunii]|uniref:NADH:flavin oxidoreductase/NADH oxidase n=1 Tax=Microbacterium caowuchunii TaxID=2614638 RepID=A0A5N0TJV6_9MICO|nr:NADH:flavin oxidoreductase/NADH oxidase [Microbacterium caowuchunii]